MKMAAKQARGKPGESRFRKFSRYFSREYDLYLMLVPVVLFYILFDHIIISRIFFCA